MEDGDLFVALAEIAGVFVGFGALISLTRRVEVDFEELSRVQGVVSVGLVVIVASLMPVTLARYGVSGHHLWWISSLVFLALIWTVILLALRSPEAKGRLIDQAKKSPVQTGFFWLCLEIPIQLPLILVLLGLFPDLGSAFYTTALVFNLFEAAFILAQLVFSRERPEAG